MSRRLPGALAALGGLALVGGVLTWATAYGWARGLGLGATGSPGGWPLLDTGPRVAAAVAVVAGVAGLVALELAPSPAARLVYASPEQYASLVTARQVQRAGELVGAAGLVVVAGALGWGAGRRPG